MVTQESTLEPEEWYRRAMGGWVRRRSILDGDGDGDGARAD